MLIDQFDIYTRIVTFSLYLFFNPCPAHHKRFFKYFILWIKAIEVSLHKINHTVKRELDIVLCVFFNFRYDSRIDVFNVHIKCSWDGGTSLSKKNRSSIVFPNIFSQRCQRLSGLDGHQTNHFSLR